MQALADTIRDGVGSIVKTMLTWWVTDPSVFTADVAPIQKLQALLLPVTLVVATASLVWQGIVMAVRRKPDPMLDAGRGLLALGFYSAAGVAVLVGAMRAADALATFFVDSSTGGQFDERMAKLFSFAKVAPGLVIVLGLLVIVVSFVQWVMLFFRQGAIVILAAFMPLAAAGSIGTATKPWLRRLLAWVCSLIVYKPLVAFTYAVAFTFIGESTDLTGVILGTVVLILSVVALPALLRFFSWGVDSAADHLGSGAAGVLAGAASLGAAALQATNGYGGSGQVSPMQQAETINQGLGPAGGGTPSGAQTSSAGGGGSGPGGPSGAGVGPVGSGGSGGPAGGSGGAAAGAGAGAAAGATAGTGAGSAATAGAAAAGPAGMAAAAASGAARMAAGAADAASGAMTSGAPGGAGPAAGGGAPPAGSGNGTGGARS